MNLKRIYTKPKGQAPDYTSPVVLKANACTIEDFCRAIHKSILDSFKHAIVYGQSVKHQPQRVGLGHVLMDEDVVSSPVLCEINQCLNPNAILVRLQL